MSNCIQIDSHPLYTSDAEQFDGEEHRPEETACRVAHPSANRRVGGGQDECVRASFGAGPLAASRLPFHCATGQSRPGRLGRLGRDWPSAALQGSLAEAGDPRRVAPGGFSPTEASRKYCKIRILPRASRATGHSLRPGPSYQATCLRGSGSLRFPVAPKVLTGVQSRG